MHRHNGPTKLHFPKAILVRLLQRQPSDVSREVAKNQTSHWPEITQTRRRCRLCCKLATCLCKKCSVYLCLSSNRNCFTEFHN
ncbi:hypothetical protein T02_6675 [Trichinella nativa]|uniref:PiggyBac transposable element-derived protein 4 C-terminal zinc-ribbon domain-containing protein n=1 Tax=Trichinella nativa TaxID=6335 RepID=A0A0V1L5M9_9BILA|nr:hypothetical protein T06_13717 [Trichinella sp. T6]KRZ50457.1 hypothetical protein T02_32 [Trichinella nativa]KRZ54318.1 hypothetical protein T02_6675 [Trichinella nativa]